MTMNIKKFLTATALCGALTMTAGIASADHERRRPTAAYHQSSGLDVIGSARLAARRGTAEFRITPEMRRDGLQLLTEARFLRVLSVELEYSDGFIERLTGRELGRMSDGSLLTIQRGRPPGLREVRVTYQMSGRDRRARLHLVQIHDGDGYTSDRDIRQADRKRAREDRTDDYYEGERDRRYYDDYYDERY
jgi:hypothetical protein